MKRVPEKLNSDPGQNGPKHMAAGFEKTALIASWGAAIPTPPMEREIGPILIMLSPFVARAGRGRTRMINPSKRTYLDNDFICYLLGLGVCKLRKTLLYHLPC
jgi:hypothetical protein